MIPWTTQHVHTTDSTMEDARRALQNGYGHGTVCTALSQNNGRGRMPGRKWEDDGAGALLFTLILDRDKVSPDFPLTQLLALALCRRLETEYGLMPRIKWPNDVLVDQRKIAGILVETEGSCYLAGIGVNILQMDYSDRLRRPAISLAAAADAGLKKPVEDPMDELPGLLSEIGALIDMKPDISEVESRLSDIGKPVTVVLGHPDRNELIKGNVSGLQNDGALLLRTEKGEIKAIYSGEIQEFAPDEN